MAAFHLCPICNFTNTQQFSQIKKGNNHIDLGLSFEKHYLDRGSFYGQKITEFSTKFAP